MTVKICYEDYLLQPMTYFLFLVLLAVMLVSNVIYIYKCDLIINFTLFLENTTEMYRDRQTDR